MDMYIPKVNEKNVRFWYINFDSYVVNFVSTKEKHKNLLSDKPDKIRWFYPERRLS